MKINFYPRTKFRLLALSLVFLVLTGISLKFVFDAGAFVIDDLKITSTPKEVDQGGKIEITAASIGVTEETKVLDKLTQANFKIETDENHKVSKYDSATKSFTINGKLGDATLKFTYTDAENVPHTLDDVIVTVKAVLDAESITATDVTDPAAEKKIDFGSEIKMLAGDEKQIKIAANDKNGDPFENLKIALTTSNAAVLDVTTQGQPANHAKLSAKAVAREQTSVLKVGDAGSFTIRVYERVTADDIRLIDTARGGAIIASGDGADSIELRGAPRAFTLRIKNFDSARIPGGKVTAVAENDKLVHAEIRNNMLILTPSALPQKVIEPENLKTTVTVSVTQADAAPVSKTYAVRVIQASRYITFDDNTIILPKDDSRTVTARVKRTGTNIEIVDAGVTWDYENPADKKWVTIIKEGNKATLVWKEDASGARPASITIKAITTGDDGQTISELVVVKMVEIAEFAKLKVKMNVLDKRTVRDLFGSVAEEEYYVVSVRMYNNLKNDKTDEYLGASILVYNGSFEVAVMLQKRYEKGSKSGNLGDDTKDDTKSYQKDGKWYDLSDADLADFRATEKWYVDNRFKKENLPIVEYGDDPPDPPCKGTITYRPLTFEMAVNSVDARDIRRTRSIVFTAIDAAATGGSFLSAINVLRGKSVVPILDRFSNLLVPGIERIYPSLKEVHRQNIVSMTMKPIEEIAFGTDLTRVVLIPKKSIRGILRDHKVRIAQICPYFFKVEVAVIRRGDKEEVTQGEQQ